MILFGIGLILTYYSVEYYAILGKLNTNLTLVSAGIMLTAVVLSVTGILLYSLISVVREKN